MAKTKDKRRKTILDTRVKLLSVSVSMNLITPFIDLRFSTSQPVSKPCAGYRQQSWEKPRS